jgi:hypothetical protein
MYGGLCTFFDSKNEIFINIMYHVDFYHFLSQCVKGVYAALNDCDGFAHAIYLPSLNMSTTILKEFHDTQNFYLLDTLNLDYINSVLLDTLQKTSSFECAMRKLCTGDNVEAVKWIMQYTDLDICRSDVLEATCLASQLEILKLIPFSYGHVEELMSELYDRGNLEIIKYVYEICRVKPSEVNINRACFGDNLPAVQWIHEEFKINIATKGMIEAALKYSETYAVLKYQMCHLKMCPVLFSFIIRNCVPTDYIQSLYTQYATQYTQLHLDEIHDWFKRACVVGIGYEWIYQTFKISKTAVRNILHRVGINCNVKMLLWADILGFDILCQWRSEITVFELGNHELSVRIYEKMSTKNQERLFVKLAHIAWGVCDLETCKYLYNVAAYDIPTSYVGTFARIECTTKSDRDKMINWYASIIQVDSKTHTTTRHQFNDSDLYTLCKVGDCEKVAVLIEHPWAANYIQQAYACAYKYKQFDIVKLLYPRMIGLELDTVLFVYGNLEIIKWIHTQHPIQFSDQMFQDACAADLRIVKWMYSYYKPNNNILNLLLITTCNDYGIQIHSRYGKIIWLYGIGARFIYSTLVLIGDDSVIQQAVDGQAIDLLYWIYKVCPVHSLHKLSQAYWDNGIQVLDKYVVSAIGTERP